MLALILAGGMGRRLNMGEKPLVKVCGRPMIERVIDAFESAGFEVVVALTCRVPYTANWCRVHRIPHVMTDGAGYVEDLVTAGKFLEEGGPIFTSVVDIPCLKPETLETIRGVYFDEGKDALSTWIPCSLIHSLGCVPRHVEMIGGIPAGSAGINVLKGEKIEVPQEEFRLLLSEPSLAFNVNTRRELERAERYLAMLH